MTVELQTTKVSATLNGVATVFSFSPLVIFESSDLVVTLVDADGNETPLTEGAGTSNYSVSVSSYPGTGSITYPAIGSAANDGTLVMKRVLPLEQAVDLDNQGGYFADVQEAALDKLVMIDLQQQEEIDRSLKFPVSDAAIGATLPTAAERANKIAGYDNDGAPTVIDGVSDAPVSSFWAPVLTSLTLAASLVAMGFSSVIRTFLAAANAVAARAALEAAGTSVSNVFTASQQIKSTDATASAVTLLELFRDSASPAASDKLIALDWLGKDSAGNNTIYARVLTEIADATNGSEDGQLEFWTMVAGTLTRVVHINSSGLAVNGFVIPFAKSFVSANQTITLAGALTLAHSLGAMPTLVQTRLKCVTAEGGYSIGDEVIIGLGGELDASATTNRGISCVPDATNLNIRFPSGNLSVGNKSSGAYFAITAANWVAIFRAWA